METEREGDQYHNAGSKPVIDLFNACNGVFRNGMLDVRKLDELGPDEHEILNVPMLRDLWVHIAGGCVQCESIINKLTQIRKALKKSSSPSSVEDYDNEEMIFKERVRAVNANPVE